MSVNIVPSLYRLAVESCIACPRPVGHRADVVARRMAAKFQEIVKQIDDQLSQIAILNKATEKVKVPFVKAYAVIGLGVLIVLLIAIGVADDFLTDLIGTAFPAFVSLKLAYAFVRNSANSV